MNCSTLGANTSLAEFTNIDHFGFWLLVQNKKDFLPYDNFPWFRTATVDQILNVQLLNEQHLHWPALDVDLSLDSLETPSAFPLIYA